MKIAVYDDNPDFGGHQVMACLGIEALASKAEIVCIINPANHQLSQKLEGFQTQEAPRNIQTLEKKFQSLDPDLVLCIQGDRWQSTKAILAAKRVGIECISYLALPHTLQAMGAKLGALRDLRTMPRPDRYIVISKSIKQQLINRGTTEPITVIPNGIKSPLSLTQKCQTSKPTLGLFGRIEFSQKRQDFMVQAFINTPDVFKDYRLLIVGNGPDEKKLTQMICDIKNITHQPWPNNPETLYEKIDLLLIPSRYEGVPLVMIEALARGIPVIGSALDGMKNLLPEAWTFEPNNAHELVKTFSNIWKNPTTNIAELQQKVLNEYSENRFKKDFQTSLLK